MFSQKRIVIKGAGDLATGVAARLWRSGSDGDQPDGFRQGIIYPYCGNDHADSLEYFAGKETAHEKLYVYHRCNNYLTCRDSSLWRYLEPISTPLNSFISTSSPKKEVSFPPHFHARKSNPISGISPSPYRV